MRFCILKARNLVLKIDVLNRPTVIYSSAYGIYSCIQLFGRIVISLTPLIVFYQGKAGQNKSFLVSNDKKYVMFMLTGEGLYAVPSTGIEPNIIAELQQIQPNKCYFKIFIKEMRCQIFILSAIVYLSFNLLFHFLSSAHIHI